MWALELSPYDTASGEMIEALYTAVAQAGYFGPVLKFHPTSEAIEKTAAKLSSNVQVITTNELYKQIVRQTHNEDWLCVSGIQGLATMVAVLWYAHHGQINLLIWDKKKPDEYRELKIDPWHVENMLFEMKKEDAA